MTRDRRGIEITAYISPMIAALQRSFFTAFHRPVLGQKLLNSSPYLLLPACTGLISGILLVLELLDHDRVINVSPDTTPGASVWVVFLVCVSTGGLLWPGHGDDRT